MNDDKIFDDMLIKNNVDIEEWIAIRDIPGLFSKEWSERERDEQFVAQQISEEIKMYREAVKEAKRTGRLRAEQEKAAEKEEEATETVTESKGLTTRSQSEQEEDA